MSRKSSATDSIRDAASTPAAESKPAAAVVATAVPTPKAERLKKSTVALPVAQVWVTCFNLIQAATAAGKPVPSRKFLVDTCINAGVAFYTSRTQVQAYLKASRNGSIIPAKLPKGVSFPSA